MSRSRKILFTLCGLAVFAAIAWGVFVAADRMAQDLAASRIRALSLTDAGGTTWRVADLGGKIGILYFGYTFCPDVCPTAMNTLALTLEKLGPARSAFQPVFISVDPARDTPKALKEYLANFDKTILGVSGSADEVKTFAHAFGVTYFVSRQKSEGEAYLIDHTAGFFLVTAEGEHVPLPITDDPSKLSAIFLRLKARLEAGEGAG